MEVHDLSNCFVIFEEHPIFLIEEVVGEIDGGIPIVGLDNIATSSVQLNTFECEE
jgi:hypothetical protein